MPRLDYVLKGVNPVNCVLAYWKFRYLCDCHFLVGLVTYSQRPVFAEGVGCVFSGRMGLWPSLGSARRRAWPTPALLPSKTQAWSVWGVEQGLPLTFAKYTRPVAGKWFSAPGKTLSPRIRGGGLFVFRARYAPF
jgi:hypothetical protein